MLAFLFFSFFPQKDMASSSFPKMRQKIKRSAPPPPKPGSNKRSDKKNQEPSLVTRSGPISSTNDHPWAGIPVQQRLFHNFDAKSKSSPVESKRSLQLAPKMEIPSQPPNRPALSSIFPAKDKPAAGGAAKPPPPTTPPDKKVTGVGSPTSVSSSSSNERSAERKSRRHILRKLPSVQQRPSRVRDRSGSGSSSRRNHSDSSSVEAMDEAPYLPYSNAIPYPPQMAVYPGPIALYPSPPVLIYPANYLPPQPEPWPEDEPPSLKDIKEDEAEDDIKGFDDFAMY